MSTFSGLNTAYTGLVAARQGLNVVGQNIANANTEGYTRQRVSTSSIGALERTGLLTGGVQIGQGVSVDAIARLGDMHLDTRVRFSAGVAGYSAVRASAMSDLETSLREPGKNGISAQLQDFWASWQDLSNRPDDPAAGGVVLEEANILANMIKRGYQEVREQFSRVRSNVDTMAAEVNGTASQVASLNEKIRFAVANGGSANELMDHRNLLTERLAALTGATVRQGSDGQVDVLIGGNALVTGSSAQQIAVAGDSDTRHLRRRRRAPRVGKPGRQASRWCSTAARSPVRCRCWAMAPRMVRSATGSRRITTLSPATWPRSQRCHHAVTPTDTCG